MYSICKWLNARKQTLTTILFLVAIIAAIIDAIANPFLIVQTMIIYAQESGFWTICMHFLTAIVFIGPICTIPFSIAHQLHRNAFIIHVAFVFVDWTIVQLMMRRMVVAIFFILVSRTINVAIAQKTRRNAFFTGFALIKFGWLTIYVACAMRERERERESDNCGSIHLLQALIFPAVEMHDG